MAKQSNKLSSGPWTLKNKQINDFVKVTALNRPNIMTIGRMLYVIEGNGNPYTYCGCIVVDPPFTKGWWSYPFLPFNKPSTGETHFKHFQAEDKNSDEWNNTYKVMFDKFIEKGHLYIKQEDPILAYYKI